MEAGGPEARKAGNLKAMSSRLEKMRGMFKMRRAPEKSEKDAEKILFAGDGSQK